MTKMTVLHFASPFAFSMPVQASTRGGRSAATAGRDADPASEAAVGDVEPAPLLEGADSVSLLAMDAPVAPVAAGHEASGLLDRVRRRYAEQVEQSGNAEEDEESSD